MPTDTNYAVQMKKISKHFGKSMVLDQVDISVKKGSIHAILGENGAGKSTLMNILYGLCKTDCGDIFLNGKEVKIKNSSIAIKNKIGMVHQHFMLIENFTVTENIILGNEVTKSFGLLDYDGAKKRILEISNRYKLKVDLDAKIENISVGMQQRVEILKALYRGADILILDEPTSVLTPDEIKTLMVTLEEFSKNGKTVIIITHKLKEIKESSSVCTIIRKGKYIDTVDVAKTTEEDLATMMVGHKVNLTPKKTPPKLGNTVLDIKNLGVENKKGFLAVNNLSLEVRAGEIVGIAGVDGNGQKELVEAITCIVSSKSGTIKVSGKEIQNTSPRDVIESGVSTIHEDRGKMGLVLDFNVCDNAALTNYRKSPYSKNGILNYNYIKNFTKELVEKFNIMPKECENIKAKGLSGGNQQKLIIAREIANNPKLIIAVQPTRGLDVGAIEYVHKVLIEERDEGKAVLLVSLELDEVLSLSDRIFVMYEGFLTQAENKKDVGFLMAGGKINAAVS